QSIGLLRARGNVPDRAPGILHRFAANELPKISVEGSEFLLHPEKRLRVLDRGRDFQPVADDARIGKELFYLVTIVARHTVRVEIVKDLAVMLAFLEDGVPTQETRALPRGL